MKLDPARAPRRTDLPFLTVRSSRSERPPAARSTPPTRLEPPVTPTPAPRLLEPPATQASTPPRLDPPAAAAPATRPPPVVSGSLLDLDDIPAEQPRTAASSTPTSPTGPTAHAAPTPGPATPRTGATPALRLPRLPGTGRLLLTPTAPVVALSRLTSGVGALRVEAAVTSGGDDVVLGCAYASTSGEASFLNPDDVQQATVAGARVPLLVTGRDRFPRFLIDLRQVRRLARSLVVLHSRSGAPVQWAGAVVVTTLSGARIDVPLDSLPASPTVAAVSLYQVDGEVVLRAENEPAASPQEACRSFGYESVAWLDAAHALV